MTAPEGLEQRYRTMLQLLPRSYRAARESELLDTLMQSAVPGQRRPSPRETVGLLGLGIRVWSRRWLSPSAETTHRAAALLAVVVPLFLIFPAVSALLFAADVAGFLDPQDINFTALLPSWTLWLAVAVLTIVGRPSWARWVSVLAVTAYVGGALAQLADHNFQTGTRTIGWLGFQLVAVLFLARADLVAAGRVQLGRWRATALGAAIGGAGVLYTAVQMRAAGDVTVRWILLGLGSLGAATLFGVLVRRTVGRAMMPVLGAGVALLGAAQNQAGGFRNGSSDDPFWGGPTTAEYLLLSAVPLVTFVVLRLLMALVPATTDEAPAH